MKEEFEIVYENYKNTVYTYLYHLTYDHFLAEDISQDVFLKVYSGIKHFKGESSLKTWILKIARNTYINYVRKNNSDLLPVEEVTIMDYTQDPEQHAINRDKGRLIIEALRGLPENYRTIIILRDQEGLSYDEIAKVMDFTLSNVKITLFRARQKFKQIYSELGGSDNVM